MEREGYYRVRKNPPLFRILQHFIAFHTPFRFFKINFNIILSFISRPSWWFLYFRIPHPNIYIFLFSSYQLLNLLISFSLTTYIITWEYELRGSSLCSFLHPPIVSSLRFIYCPQYPVLKCPLSIFFS
jgi:hypothetical protein